MKRALLVTLIAGLSAVGFAQAKGPTTKQNGSEPVISAFTSICAVPGYANYGFCGGDATKFTNVGGKMNAVQPKAGKYNLDFSFTNLTPGVEYRLWATREGGMPSSQYQEVGRMFADEAGSLQFKFQTDSPDGLGFDLNTINEGDITIVTSWWSGQSLVQNVDGTLSTAS